MPGSGWRKLSSTTWSPTRLSESGPAASRPEFAPFDFSKNAYPDIPALSALRLFSREAMVLRVEDGKYKAVTPFGDATKPFDLES